jgi:hypothetical protein
MKIEGPRQTSSAGKASNTTKAGSKGASFSSYLSETDDAESTNDAGRVIGVGGMLGLLSVQANEQATEREQRRQAYEYGEDLLADLDSLRVGLILGEYNQMQLQGLVNRVQQRQKTDNDQGLNDILADIELRAQVELAKLQR